MAQYLFERKEEKYLLNPWQYRCLLSHLRDHLIPEKYGRHTIRNLYFDTSDYRLIRKSLEKPVYKEKLRLRAYGCPSPSDEVYLELKKKFKGIVYKRRVAMTLAEVERYLYEHWHPPTKTQILREIEYFRRFYAPLTPRVFLAYERTAYFFQEDIDMRITFDESIRARTDNLRLNGDDGGTPLLTDGSILMELKIPDAIPLWLNHLFADLRIYPVAFSKYGTYYREGILPGIQYGKVERLYAV